MKKMRKFICILLIAVSLISINNFRISAEEVEYTDNVIPIMISNTSSGGTAGAEYGAQNAWKAFDHDSTTAFNGWSSDKINIADILSYEFKNSKCITKYTIVSRAVPNEEIRKKEVLSQLPKSWTFEAWNDKDKKWDILDKRENITDWQYGVKKEFTFDNSYNYAYKIYRINITANNGTTFYTSIGELEMMETKTNQTSQIEGNKAILEVVMTNGTIKEYDLTIDELEKFIIWYDNRSDGIGKSYFKMPKKSNVKPFLSRNEYITYDKIYSFEVKDYNE